MGEKQGRNERFRLKHPKCCFCGGTAATETIDHVPPKIVFVGSQLPAGSDIEFPACDACNKNSRQYDQIAAMLALTSPRKPKGDETSHFLKAVRGVRNNAGGAIDEINRGFAGWRHLGKEFATQTGTQARATELGPINLSAMLILTAKLGMAYYYRETGRIVPTSGAVVADLVTNTRLLRGDIPDEYKLAAKFHTMSKHDTREQFLYRHILMEDAAGGMFQFAIHLNFMLIAMVVEERDHHPVEIGDERTFLPGFLKSLPVQIRRFSVSTSFNM